MREELCSQAGDLLQLCPINLNESLELGVWLMPPVELSPSLGSRNRPLSASCWLALRTPQTLCCSVLVLYDTAKLDVLDVKTRWLVFSRHSESLPPCLLTTRVKSSRGWRSAKRTGGGVVCCIFSPRALSCGSSSSSSALTSLSIMRPNLVLQHLRTLN